MDLSSLRYSHYEEQLAKNKAFNREKSQDYVAEVDEIVPGTEWDRVMKPFLQLSF